MGEVVDAQELAGGLRVTAGRLCGEILASALSKDDKRFDPASTMIVRAVWQSYREAEVGSVDPAKPTFELDANGITAFLRGIEGRVLTVLECVFPPGQQCEALKSLARQEVWETRKRVGFE